MIRNNGFLLVIIRHAGQVVFLFKNTLVDFSHFLVGLAYCHPWSELQRAY